MIASVKALARRRIPDSAAPSTFEQEVLQLGVLTIESYSHSVRLDGQLIDLTPKEFELMVLLARNPELVYSREDLLELVWDMDFAGGTRTVDIHIQRLPEEVRRMARAHTDCIRHWLQKYESTLMRRRHIGLKGRNALLLALLLAFVLTVLSSLVLAGIRDDQRSRLEQTFAHQADVANLRVREAFLTRDRVLPDIFMKESALKLAIDLGEMSGIAVTLYSADGTFAGTSLPVQTREDVKDALAYTELSDSRSISR